jgi:hypothetical protein
MTRRYAATIIQRFYRSCRYRAIDEENRVTEEAIIHAVTLLQAMYRGGAVRTRLLEAASMEETNRNLRLLSHQFLPRCLQGPRRWFRSSFIAFPIQHSLVP